MIEAKISGALGSDLTNATFGMKVRYSRLQIKMPAEQAGILYAKAIGRQKSYTARRIEQMELHDDFPADQARRWAIAKIVQMSLFFTLDPEIEMALPRMTPQTVKKKKRRLLMDLQDYEVQLRRYWEDGVSGTLEETMEDISDRIYKLHDNVLYVDRKQKSKMLRLLCGYNIIAAQTLEERKEYTLSQNYLDRAIVLARENNYSDLRATALIRRAAFAVDQRCFDVALTNCQASLRLKSIPPQLQGHTLSVAAKAKASLASTQANVDEALRWQSEAEKMIGKDTLTDFDFLVSFDEERYCLNRGATYMKSPVKKLRSTEKALEYLPPLSTNLDLSLRQADRQAFNHVVQAWIYIDQALYAIATTLAEDALSLLERIHSKVHLDELAEICEVLKKSPYGKSTDVAILEIGVMRNMRPELFN